MDARQARVGQFGRCEPADLGIISQPLLAAGDAKQVAIEIDAPTPIEPGFEEKAALNAARWVSSVSANVPSTSKIRARIFMTSALRGGADRRDIGAIVFRPAAFEHGRASDKRVSASARNLARIVDRDAAVDLQTDRPRPNQIAKAAYLFQLRSNESLTAKPRIDRHDEDQVNAIDDILQRTLMRSGANGDARFLA